MTSVDQADVPAPEIARIRSAIADHLPDVARAISPAALQAASEHLAELAEHRATAVRARMLAAREREAARPPRHVPHGIVVVARSLGMAWAALMLSTLTIAFIMRSTARKAAVALEPDQDEIHLQTVLAPMAFTSRAAAFRGGAVDCLYGGGFVDLREATLDPADAELRVRVVFGGGQIIVPETWRVTAKVRGIGGLHDARPAVDLPADAPHLTITGLAVFGGWVVQSELPEAQAAAMKDAVAQFNRQGELKPDVAPSV